MSWKLIVAKERQNIWWIFSVIFSFILVPWIIIKKGIWKSEYAYPGKSWAPDSMVFQIFPRPMWVDERICLVQFVKHGLIAYRLSLVQCIKTTLGLTRKRIRTSFRWCHRTQGANTCLCTELYYSGSR